MVTLEIVLVEGHSDGGDVTIHVSRDSGVRREKG